MKEQFIYDLRKKVGRHYGLIAAAWSDDTAHPNYRPLPQGRPPSYGQCEVGHAALLDMLRPDYPDTPFRLVWGRVLAASQDPEQPSLKEIIPDGHIWIDCGSREELNRTVVDIAGDQSDPCSLFNITVAPYDWLTDIGIVYQPREFYESADEFAAILRQYGTGFDDRLRTLNECLERLTRYEPVK